MCCRLTAVFVSFLLIVQSIDLTCIQSLPCPSDFDLPEVDGSAVDDICRIFSVTTTDPITTTTITTTTTPITRKQVVTTTKKPAVQSPPKKPETKNTGTPVRELPAPGPNTYNLNNPAASLLYHILLNSRGHAAGSLPRLNTFISQPIGGLRLREDSTSSHSDELEATLMRRAGWGDKNRWKIGSFSSEDSSDE